MADIKLAESEMELESLERANREFDGRLKILDEEIHKHHSPSLHSLRFEDRPCLTKIRQLGEQEVQLKRTIRELENHEALFQGQLNRMLTAKEFCTTSCGRKNCDTEINERRKLHSRHPQKLDFRWSTKEGILKGKKVAHN